MLDQIVVAFWFVPVVLQIWIPLAVGIVYLIWALISAVLKSRDTEYAQELIEFQKELDKDTAIVNTERITTVASAEEKSMMGV